LGLGRELDRLCKPQAFFFADLRRAGSNSGLSSSAIENYWRIYARDVQATQLKFLTETKARGLCGTSVEFTYGGDLSEELRVNLALAFKHKDR